MDRTKGCLLLLLVTAVCAVPEDEKCGTGPACPINSFCDRTRIDRPRCLQCHYFLKFCFTNKIPSRCQDLCKKNHEKDVASRVRKEEEQKCETRIRNLTNTENQMYEKDVEKLKDDKCVPNRDIKFMDYIPYIVAIVVSMGIIASLSGVFITKIHKSKKDLKETAFQPLADGPKPAELKVKDVQVQHGVQVVQDNEPPRSCNDYELLPDNEPLDYRYENPA